MLFCALLRSFVPIPHSFLSCLCLFCIKNRCTTHPTRALFAIFHPFFVFFRQFQAKKQYKKRILKGAAVKFRQNIVIFICKFAPQTALYHQKSVKTLQKKKNHTLQTSIRIKNRKIERFFETLHPKTDIFYHLLLDFLPILLAFERFSANRAAKKSECFT